MSHTGEQLPTTTTKEPAVTTQTVTNQTSIASTSNRTSNITTTSSSYNTTLPEGTSTTPMPTHPVPCEPFVVPVYTNTFCSDKPDGFYMDSSGNFSSSILQCSDGVTHIAWCPNNHNKARLNTPAMEITLVMVMISSLWISVWANG